MVSYYNHLAMFPQAGRPAPPSTTPSLYPSYHGYNQYPPHDQNSNLQLYAGVSQFSADFPHSASGWPPHAWPSTGFSCRSYPEWPAAPPILDHVPQPASSHSPPTSEGDIASPSTPPYNSSQAEGGDHSPAPTDSQHYLNSTPQYKFQFSPSSSYKSDHLPVRSAAELGIPPGITVTTGPGPASQEEGPLTPNRPQPARSPYEWMKKPSYQAHDQQIGEPNGRTRTKDKYRIVYSDHQRLELEKEFHYSRYITIRRKAELANGIGLSERQVKIWFQNRRAKERRALKKHDDVTTKDKLDSSSGSLAAFSPPSMSLGEQIHQHNSLMNSLNHQLPPSFSQSCGTFPGLAMKFE